MVRDIPQLKQKRITAAGITNMILLYNTSFKEYYVVLGINHSQEYTAEYDDGYDLYCYRLKSYRNNNDFSKTLFNFIKVMTVKNVEELYHEGRSKDNILISGQQKLKQYLEELES